MLTYYDRQEGLAGIGRQEENNFAAFLILTFFVFLSLSLSSGFCHGSESADVALFGAMRGAGPVQGAHDGAVRLPQVQLSVQKGEQVRGFCSGHFHRFQGARLTSFVSCQVLPLLQHRPPEPECDVRAREPGCGADCVPGSKHFF